MCRKNTDPSPVPMVILFALNLTLTFYNKIRSILYICLGNDLLSPRGRIVFKKVAKIICMDFVISVLKKYR